MLTQEEVKHIADLARIELSARDTQKFREQLSAILDYFQKLQEVKTDEVATADGGTRDLFNIWRADRQQTTDNKQQTTSDLINLAPEQEKGQVKVKKIL